MKVLLRNPRRELDMPAPRTVEQHVAKVLRKLGRKSRLDLTQSMRTGTGPQ